MSEIESYWKAAERPIIYFSEEWTRNIERRKELHRKLWELLIDVSNAGRHPENDGKYKICFSSVFYGHEQPANPGKKPSDIVGSILSLLRKYGTEFPAFVPVVVVFKRHLEKYEWTSDEVLVIQDLAQFDEGIRKFVQDLGAFLDQDRWQASRTVKFLRYFAVLVAVPFTLSAVLFPLILRSVSREVFASLVRTYRDGVAVWMALVLAIAISYFVVFLVLGEQPRRCLTKRFCGRAP